MCATSSKMVGESTAKLSDPAHGPTVEDHHDAAGGAARRGHEPAQRAKLLRDLLLFPQVRVGSIEGRQDADPDIVRDLLGIDPVGSEPHRHDDLPRRG